MAQRNSPSRRIPDSPLAGLLRTVAYQARYSDRRRADVPTITSADQIPDETPVEPPATPVAETVAFGDVVVSNGSGSATVTYPDRDSVPVVTATAHSASAVIVTFNVISETSATLTTWDAAGVAVGGVTVQVTALWS
jgi:hypothetical protein